MRSTAITWKPRKQHVEKPKFLQTSKRNSSQDEVSGEVKRNKVEQKPSNSQPRRLMSEMARDHLQVALVDETHNNGKIFPDMWNKVKDKLSELVMEYLLCSEKRYIILVTNY